MGSWVMTEDALNYKNEWVSFSGDLQRVLGHGLTTKEASDMAKTTGEKDAFLFFIPQEWPEALVL